MRHFSYFIPPIVADNFTYELFTNAGSTDTVTLGNMNWFGIYDMGDGNVIDKTEAGGTFNYTYASALDGQVKRIRYTGSYDTITVNILRDLRGNAIKLTGTADISKLTDFVNSFDLKDNPGLTALRLPLSGARKGDLILTNNTGLAGVFDISAVSGEGFRSVNLNSTSISKYVSHVSDTVSSVSATTCPNLSEIVLNHPVTGLSISGANYSALKYLFTKEQTLVFGQYLVNAVNIERVNSATYGVFDLRKLRGGINAAVYPGNTNHTTHFYFPHETVTVPASGGATYYGNGMSKLQTVHLGSQKFTGEIRMYSCPLLESVNLSGACLIQTNSNIRFDSCKLNQRWFLGTKILPGGTFNINNNQHSQANMDLNINDVYVNRTAFNNAASKTFSATGTGNAAPSGNYQAPTGYVQGGSDGTPATAKEQIYVLVNQTNADSTLKYKWTFNVN